MPQIFLVLRCYECLVFQVQQAKRTNKFQCKLCGEKQSIKKNYGIGTAKDCRMHVQKLNGIRGEIDELKQANTGNADTSDDCDDADIDMKVECRKPKKSKWSDFVNDTEQTREPLVQDSMYLNDTEVVLEVPKKCKKSFNCPRRKVIPPNDTSNVNNACPFIKEDISNMIDNHPRYEDKEIVELSKKTIQNATNLATVKHINSTKQPLEEKKVCAFRSNINEKNNETPDVRKKRQFVCPKISNNSKWAQFIENEDCLENSGSDEINKSDDEPNTTNILDKKDFGNPQDLFALCDDSDLDNILDI